MLKKYLKEGLITIFLIFIVSTIIGYYRSSNVKANNLNILKNYTTIDGVKVDKILNQNKPLILNFWGTWCPVCNQEVSTLSSLAKRDDFILITVAVNSGSKQDIKEFMQKKGIKFLVINDKDGKLANRFNISVFPTTIFFNSKRDNIIKDSGYTTKAGFLARVKLVER